MTLLREVFKKIMCILLLVVSGCSLLTAAQDQSFSFGKSKVALPNLNIRKKYKKDAPVEHADVPVSNSPKQVSGEVAPTIRFDLKNDLGRKVFLVPFAYVKRFLNDTWHWVNLDILELEQGQSGVVDVGTFNSVSDAESVFGSLRLCTSAEEAASATYELSEDYQRVDVGLLSELHKKTITLHASKYGVGGERISYEVSPSKWKKVLPPLDFVVRNTHKEPVFVTAFFYGKEQDCDPLWSWRFTKSPVYALKPGESATVKVDIIKDPYDWKNIKGFLGVFNQNESLKAENATYELLVPSEKIALGPLSKIVGKEGALTSRLYGLDTIFDFSTTLPVRASAPASGTTMAAT